MADEFTFKLNNPITEEEWDLITDVDLDNTPSVMFHTKHDKDVEYVKVVRCKDCKHRSYWVCDPSDKPLWARCDLIGELVAEDDFCSRGERKESEE